MCRKYCKKSILSLSVNLASLSDPSKLEPLIIDGRESKEKEFPHMVSDSNINLFLNKPREIMRQKLTKKMNKIKIIY